MPTLSLPLHPLIVHMPIALTILVPLFAIGAFWAVSRGANVNKAWGLATGLIAATLLSGWIALQTGQNEEEKVEEVVNEGAIHEHEEAAEGFLVTTGIVLLLAGAGLLKGRPGTIARGVATVGTLAMVGAGVNVGHSGGSLVYKEGAAMAYASPTAGGEGRKGGEGREDADEKNESSANRVGADTASVERAGTVAKPRDKDDDER